MANNYGNKAGNVVYLEKEEGTGLILYKLSIGETVCCISENLAPMPRSYTAPIQTEDLLHDRTFKTTKNPTYEDITIVPGLKMDYPVFDGDDPEPIAHLKVTIQSNPYGSAMYEYCVYDEHKANPRISLESASNEPIGAEILEWLPINDVAVSIYPDESFVYDPRSTVEKRYIVSMHEKHRDWLHHIFHAFILQHTV